MSTRYKELATNIPTRSLLKCRVQPTPIPNLSQLHQTCLQSSSWFTQLGQGSAIGYGIQNKF